jgi:hypothetical protein
MKTETVPWWIVLGPLCALLALSLIFGPSAVSGAFEWVFDGIARVVLVWLAMLGFI